MVSCGKEPSSTIPLPDQGENGNGGETGDMTSLTVYGKVLDDKGQPYVGVVMTDGRNFAVTDENGYYRFEKYRYASFIQCSIPSDAAITKGGSYNMAECHFKRLVSSTKEYNFTYARGDGGKKFRILALGDPQVSKDSEVDKYRLSAKNDINQYMVDASPLPSYGITLGDNVENAWDYLPKIAAVFGEMNLPVFATIGNHDHEFPVENEAAARKKYEDVFGPANFSFNRGDVHIVVFDDVMHNGGASSDYTQGYEPWQLEWLKKDLSYVPKDKVIFMTAHIPLTDKAVIDLLSEYKSAFVVCGHTHNVENNRSKTSTSGKLINICAAGSTGAPWKGTILSDGCERGYKVYEFNGTALEREVYKCIRYQESFQARMFRTADFPPYTTAGNNTYSFPYNGENWIAVNIFNFKSTWKATLIENGVESPNAARPIVSYDVWAKVFLYTKYDRDTTTGKNDHMLFFNVNNPSSEIKIKITDEFGQEFICDSFTPKDFEPVL